MNRLISALLIRFRPRRQRSFSALAAGRGNTKAGAATSAPQIAVDLMPPLEPQKKPTVPAPPAIVAERGA